jgi:hypothetical protein
VAEVLAGFVIGYAISLIVSPLAAWSLVSSNSRSGFAQRIAPPGTNVVALSAVLHFATVLLLTALGMVLGMALTGIEGRRPDGGIGSPNLIYTLIVVALAAVMIIPAIAVPMLRRYALIGGIVFVALFGWAMPWLATFGD